MSAVHVLPEQAVEAGETLVTLENPELAAARQAVVSRIAETRIRARSRLLDTDLAAAQTLREELASLEEHLAELDRRTADLEVRAPATGTVLGRRLDELLGQRIGLGEALMSVIETERKTAHISIPAAELPKLDLDATPVVDLSFAGHGTQRFHAHAAEVSPRASVRIDLPALSATSGGPVAVRPRTAGSLTSPAARGGYGGDEIADQFEFLEPRVVLEADLDTAAAAALRAGEIGVAHLATRPERATNLLTSAVRDWFDHLLAQRTAAL